MRAFGYLWEWVFPDLHFFSGFLLLDASWDSDTPVLFFMDYGRFFGTRGLEKRECNRGVLIRGWICEWVDRLGAVKCNIFACDSLI